MPLSEEEQRILHEIERSFYAGEQAAGSSAGSRATEVRRVRLAAVGFVVSLVLLLIGFASNFFVGAVAFLAMVGTGAILVDGAQRVGGDRLRSSAGRIGSMVSDPSRRLRPRRFRSGDGDDDES
ncbi:MAG TPA: DUF3040 domain-containing protein [Acidimicrobiales bacterium]|nr:DUF3040 domain-containing protein [Acidimicrobiales bacterium]